MEFDQDTTSQISDLDKLESDRVKEFMKVVVHAFEDCEPERLTELSHEGGDPRGEKNSFEFNKGLMEGGDRVKSWAARRYTEPDWEIMKSSNFSPKPSIWIDVTLSDGKREYPIFFAVATDADGDLRACYYIDR